MSRPLFDKTARSAAEYSTGGSAPGEFGDLRVAGRRASVSAIRGARRRGVAA